MLELVLSSTADQVLHPQAGNYDGMKFLCDLFSCCELDQLICMRREKEDKYSSPSAPCIDVLGSA